MNDLQQQCNANTHNIFIMKSYRYVQECKINNNKKNKIKISITYSKNYTVTIYDVLTTWTNWSNSKRDKLTGFGNSKLPSLIKTILSNIVCVAFLMGLVNVSIGTYIIFVYFFVSLRMLGWNAGSPLCFLWLFSVSEYLYPSCTLSLVNK